MDNERKAPAEKQQPDVFEQEERCQKAIKTVSKAIAMRLFVAALMIWAVCQTAMDLWVWGLMALVFLIDLVGMLPLWQELKKQRALLKELIAKEEE